MTLTELRYIVAVARERHFGRAAESCFVSQPTLSVAVRKLEEELGVVLFERGRSEVVITPIGERIVSQASRALEEADSIKLLAEQGRDQVAGPLRLGVIYTVGPYLLSHLIPELNRAAPEMQLVIEENYTHVLTEQLRRAELDVIVISLPYSQSQVVTWDLYDEPFVVVLPSSHPWTKRESIAPRDLADENLLLLGEGHCFRDQVLEACPGCLRSEGGGLQRGLEGSSLETIRYMVATGLGITVLPVTSAQPASQHEELLTVRPFRGTPPSRRIALAWRRSFPRIEAVRTLRDAILSCGLPKVSVVSGQAPQAEH